MTEILPGIHQVEGVDPSPEFTTHVYLLRDRADRYALIDTGLPGSERAILAYLERIGVAPEQVTSILLTHLHNDHTGTLAHLVERTGAQSYAHWLEAAFIAGRPRYDGPGAPPEHPFEVGTHLKDGDRVDIAGGLVAYHTPGHTPGHLSYYLPQRRLMFSGDLFFGLPDLALTPPTYTIHTLSAQVSARRLAELPIDSLLTYHGGPFLEGAGPKLKRLVEKF